MSHRDRVRIGIELLAALAAMLAGSAIVRYAHGQTERPEDKMGAIGNKKSAAANNTEWLQNKISAGAIATAPVGKLYINDTIVWPPENPCGRIRSASAGSGYPMDDHATLSGRIAQIVQLAPGKPIFRASGAGLLAEEPIELIHDQDASDAEPASAIEVEGRASPATGRGSFRNLLFRGWDSAFKALGGYYVNGLFVADENHADNCIVRKCETMQCKRLFWSQNEQAVNWSFHDCIVNGLGLAYDFVAFDIERGGCPKSYGLVIEESQFTMFRTRDFSPNNCCLTSRDFFFDRFTNPNTNFCVFEYAGSPTSVAWSKWILEVDGFVATQLKPIEQHELYRNVAGLPRDYWNVKLRHIPQE